MATPPTKEWIESLLEPAMLLGMAMKSYIQVSLETALLHRNPLALILRTNRLRDEAFGRFWMGFSEPQTTQQEDELKGSAALIPPILSHATGTVLDVGPGSGTQMPLLARNAEAIKNVYGAEPCAGLHESLCQKAHQEGLEGKYHVLPCGVSAGELVPELEKRGLGGEGIFDTIVCVRVLCSVPDLPSRTKELHKLLKPGGKLLFVEHVVNPWRSAKGSILARLMQAVYQLLGWSWFLGDCCLVRDTEGALRRTADADGGWEVVDVERSFGWSVLSYISGVLVKRG